MMEAPRGHVAARLTASAICVRQRMAPGSGLGTQREAWSRGRKAPKGALLRSGDRSFPLDLTPTSHVCDVMWGVGVMFGVV